jgi:hypothetical protein
VPQKKSAEVGQHSKHKRKSAIASLIAIVIPLHPTSPGHVLPRGVQLWENTVS